MKTGELKKILMQNGWYLHRQAKGSHEIWRHSSNTNSLIIPNHNSKEVGTGLCNKLLKQAGLK